jgi:hypothetical protein
VFDCGGVVAVLEGLLAFGCIGGRHDCCLRFSDDLMMCGFCGLCGLCIELLGRRCGFVEDFQFKCEWSKCDQAEDSRLSLVYSRR